MKEKELDNLSITFSELKKEILKRNIKSEYQQTCIVILRSIFKEKNESDNKN